VLELVDQVLVEAVFETPFAVAVSVALLALELELPLCA